MKESNQIHFTEPAKTVSIVLPDGRCLEGPVGTPLSDFFKVLEEKDQGIPLICAVVNGELRELTFEIEIESRVTPLNQGTTDGMRVYRRSLTFLLEAAFEELFSGAILNIDHSVFSGGYFCQVWHRDSLTQDELDKLEARMFQLVNQDIPFTRLKVPLAEAVEYFESIGADDKVKLLAHRKKDYLMIYQFSNHRDYHYGYMVPSSGYLKWFKLTLMDGGFILQFPRRNSPLEILPLTQSPKLLSTFQDYGKWLDRLGITNVGTLNEAIETDRFQELILVSEALHERRVAAIASKIVHERENARAILIAGPSSSGKTTFSKRLTVQLLAHGLSPFPLELDNFFVERDQTPKDEFGEFDFEHIDAIDRKLLNKLLKKMIAGEEVRLPRFNFSSGIREPGEIVQLQPGQVVILEGIHGLNPDLVPDIPSEQTFRVYLSALTQLNLDRHNRVSTTDTRLIRRIVRDARKRGYSPQETIGRWESVRRGEKRYIFPYQENADVMFNSALVYELSALKPYAEPLLRQVPYNVPEYIEAKRLLTLLEWFLPIEKEYIPNNSLLREFIGGSILQHFKLWKNNPED
ncbi:MAG: nucleoside kinase [Anaerolineales bacterium]|nr:nucleoside kinase [Anaerolineales bacterium]